MALPKEVKWSMPEEQCNALLGSGANTKVDELVRHGLSTSFVGLEPFCGTIVTWIRICSECSQDLSLQTKNTS